MATEKRLIDRNEIFPNGTFFANAEDPLKSLDELIARIWSIPTVDAVEAVRCKDCKHFIKEEHGCDHHGYFYPVRVMDNDFCSYGERKDNG